MDLNEIRVGIDQVDRQLVALLEERMDLVSQVAAYKEEHSLPVLILSESALLDKVGQLVSNQAYSPTIQATFESIMTHSKAYQSKKLGLEE